MTRHGRIWWPAVMRPKTGEKMEYHNINPVYDEHSRILILGSFPSVKSREQQFFYGHKQNRFWKLLARLFDCPAPETAEEKKALLLSHRVAVWDVISSCEINGSSDSSICNVVPNDLAPILETAQIQQIFANGNTSYSLYQRYLLPKTGREIIKLPSTSPANAAFSLDRLVKEWEQIRTYL